MKINTISAAIKNEINLFFLALTFLTRIPGPQSLKFAPEYLNRSSRYFSSVGIIVGVISAVIFVLSYSILPLQVSIILSMICSIFVTGAFHEDGFADVCDGFGGGYDKDQIIRIMKDSRIGTYGSVGLILILFLKLLCLLSVNPRILPFVIIAGHSLSRFASTAVIFRYDYVSDDIENKSKPLATQLNFHGLTLNAIFGTVPIVLTGNMLNFFIIIPVFFSAWVMTRYFVKKIGGYTGDCLGAIQQISEVVFYLFILIKF